MGFIILCESLHRDGYMILLIDLQLFADQEKTEQATPRKRKKSREEGQVLFSKEVNTAFTLLAAFVLLFLLSGYYGSRMSVLTINTYENLMLDQNLYSISNIHQLVFGIVINLIIIISPLAAVVLVIGLLCSYMQVGFLLTTKPLQPKLNKLSPIKGLKKLFSMEKVMELFKSLVKIGFITYIVVVYLAGQLQTIFSLTMLDVEQTVAIIRRITFNIGFRAGIILVLLGILDYFYQRYEYEKKLKMSKQEVKDEQKQIEGDPKIKSKIRQKQMQISMRRMMDEVPKADVVVTNPTHYAIALKYSPGEHTAPLVLAKGQNLVAQNIKKIAFEKDVPTVENRYLAKTLYETVGIGDAIPPDLYESVAEILAYVYQLNQSKKGGS